MVANISAWAALAAALLSIGLEIWRARNARSARNEPRPAPTAKRSAAHTLAFTRGVTAWSVVPFFALVLAAHALGLYADSFELRAEIAAAPGQIEDSIEAFEIHQIASLLYALTTVIGIIAGFLGLRIVVHYIIRVEDLI